MKSKLSLIKCLIHSGLILLFVCVNSFADDPTDLVALRMKTNNVSSVEFTRICNRADAHIGQPYSDKSIGLGGVLFAVNSDTSSFWTVWSYSRVQFTNQGLSPIEPYLGLIQGTNRTSDQFEIKVFTNKADMVSRWDLFIPSITP